MLVVVPSFSLDQILFVATQEAGERRWQANNVPLNSTSMAVPYQIFSLTKTTALPHKNTHKIFQELDGRDEHEESTCRKVHLAAASGSPESPS